MHKFWIFAFIFSCIAMPIAGVTYLSSNLFITKAIKTSGQVQPPADPIAFAITLVLFIVSLIGLIAVNSMRRSKP